MNVTDSGANKDAVGAKTKDNSVRDTLAHLMLRNLSEVFGERDSKRRMAAINNLYSEDAVFFEAEQRFEGRQTISDAFRPVFPPSSNSRRWLPLPAITTSGDCSGDSVLQAFRPSSTGWTLRSSKMAASTRFTSSSTTRTIRGRGRKSIEGEDDVEGSGSLLFFYGHIEAMANAVAEGAGRPVRILTSSACPRRSLASHITSSIRWRRSQRSMISLPTTR